MEEPPGLELLVSNFEINMIHCMPRIHISPMNSDSCHFKQGELIFDNESRFFKNKTSCLSHNEKISWDNDTKDNSGACEDDSNNDVAELIKSEKGNENDTGLSAYDKRVSPLSDWLKRRKRKKKKIRKRSMKIKFDEGCAEMMKGSNSHVNSLKRTHLESGKRSRGRNRHSLRQV